MLLLGGLVAGGVMLAIASRLDDRAIDDFARAGVGCRTTLDFQATGTFFVYQELAGDVDELAGDCEPAGEPGRPFGVEQVDGPAEVAFVGDDSIDYDTGEHVGRSISTFVVEEAGQYEISVRGSDIEFVAAIGRDPSDAVNQTRTAAIVVAAAGVVLGGLLLLSGRRSQRSAAPSVATGPEWGVGHAAEDRPWPPAPPTIGQRPINPQQPDAPTRPMPPPPPPGSPWAAPSQPAPLPPPPPPPPATPPAPASEPRMPDR